MKTKFFRVAVEGATTDGRTIERSWLQDIAETYNRATYAARVNLEHIRGITADGPFQAYGDVISVKTDEFTFDLGGKQETRLALYAEVDALDPLVAMNAKKQKLYSSIEVQPNFAGTGKAYLVGLAVTDSPASLGTEMLQFAAKLVADGKESPLAARKQDPANLFTAAQEITLEFVEDSGAGGEVTGLLSSIKGLLVKLTAPVAAAEPAAKPAVIEPVAADATAAQFALIGDALTSLAQAHEAFARTVGERFTALTGELSAVKATLEKMPAPGFAVHRVRASGAVNGERTDC